MVEFKTFFWNCEHEYHTQLMQMSNKINQLQYIHLELDVKMLPYHLFCLHLVVLEYVAMYILLIVDYIIIPFQSYQLETSIDTPNGLNLHLMDQLCSISKLKDSK